MYHIPLTPQYTREQLRDRFLNVIRLAGYTSPGVAESICEAWLDKLMAKGIPGFIKMLEDYEREDGDPI